MEYSTVTRATIAIGVDKIDEARRGCMPDDHLAERMIPEKALAGSMS